MQGEIARNQLKTTEVCRVQGSDSFIQAPLELLRQKASDVLRGSTDWIYPPGISSDVLSGYRYSRIV